MVHTRLNERETNPNPHINFITPLPMADEAVQEEARQLLRALAAQLKPIMKSHGLSVNSFEEVSCDNLPASLWSRSPSHRPVRIQQSIRGKELEQRRGSRYVCD